MTFDEGTSYPQPDRRYWRRRVNRHVRKARRTRALLRVAGILLANVLVGVVLFLTGATVVRHVTTSKELAVREIVVDGASRTTPDAVRAVLREFLGKNILEVSLEDIAQAATRDPWVREASVKRLLPGTLRVLVTERTPAALALLRGAIVVVDDRGVVMGPAGPGMPFDLPVLTGLLAPQGPALDESLAKGVTLLSQLTASHAEWARGISELDLTLPDRVVVTLRSGGPLILLDPGRIDRNLDDFLQLQPMIARRVGSVTRVDLRWDRRIALLPGGNSPLTESE
ncbi:MAG TPA: FtsQ-type POTRA domain-containing protein [Candidatus Polarisedimenticolaceae bacterium]|nr:FtsQ-type POTRA domain-containing protein [Candidatus Polarisedimenticolaceae bacterium]